MRRPAARSILLVACLAVGLAAPREAISQVSDPFENECGVYCLYTLLGLESPGVGLAEIRRTLPDPNPTGLSMAEIRDGADRLGLSLRGSRLTSREIPLDRPAIALLRPGGRGHFVVLRPVGVLGKMVMILDFPRPPRVVDYSDLIARPDWTGLMLRPVTPLERAGPWAASASGVALIVTGLFPVLRRMASRRHRDDPCPGGEAVATP